MFEEFQRWFKQECYNDEILDVMWEAFAKGWEEGQQHYERNSD